MIICKWNKLKGDSVITESENENNGNVSVAGITYGTGEWASFVKNATVLYASYAVDGEPVGKYQKLL